MADKKQFVYHINDLPFTPLVEEEGIVTQFILGDNIQISFIQNPPGATFPLHAHDAEQILIMLEGSEEHIIDGQEVHMEAGRRLRASGRRGSRRHDQDRLQGHRHLLPAAHRQGWPR